MWRLLSAYSCGRPGLDLAPQPAAWSSVVGQVSCDLADSYDTLAQRKWLGGKSLDCRTRTRSPREDPGISRLLPSDAPSRDSTGGQQTSSALRPSSHLCVFKFCNECVALLGGALIAGPRVVPTSQGAYVTGQVFSLRFLCCPSVGLLCRRAAPAPSKASVTRYVAATMTQTVSRL